MNRITLLLSICLIVGSISAQNVRIKDVASITGLEDVQLVGYGLVVGLAGTGDKSQTVFTEQTIINMLKNMGIEIQDKNMRIRNVASVMVTGTLTPFKRKGTRFDITVSSLGDATSLEGGTLIITPLQGGDGTIYATCQGPIATGGYDIRDNGLNRIKKNHTLVGRIPGGAIVQKEYEFNVLDNKELSLSLSNPDFSSAVAMSDAINNEFGTNPPSVLAKAVDASTIVLDYSLVTGDTTKRYMSLVEFISRVENLTFNVYSQAKVVVNERTGTIVAGGSVKISEVAVSHGSVKVEIVSKPEVIQPQPFTMGQTASIPNSELAVEEKDTDMVVLDQTTTVSDLAQALNSLGVAPRDVIQILQAIKEAGALQAQLVIM
ncbi:MAG: flagellar basal body P-ring protein FlgI [Fibrobacter sp.]|nr:flagellar basal body P-ring protein FlgI [Fibrobacter sp.]